MEPLFLLEEKIDFLIIGDTIEDNNVPSLGFQDWLARFAEQCRKNEQNIKSVSAYFITSPEIDVKKPWIDFYRKNPFSLAIFPPILHFKLKELTLEKSVIKSIKDYSNEFIELFITNKKRGR